MFLKKRATLGTQMLQQPAIFPSMAALASATTVAQSINQAVLTLGPPDERPILHSYTRKHPQKILQNRTPPHKKGNPHALETNNLETKNFPGPLISLIWRSKGTAKPAKRFAGSDSPVIRSVKKPSLRHVRVCVEPF